MLTKLTKTKNSWINLISVGAFHPKSEFRNSSLSFFRFNWDRITDKFAINWQNFARVRL